MIVSAHPLAASPARTPRRPPAGLRRGVGAFAAVLAVLAARDVAADAGTPAPAPAQVTPVIAAALDTTNAAVAADTARARRRFSNLSPEASMIDSDAPEGMPIRKVEVRTLDIYEPPPPGRLHAFYKVANQLHVVSRPVTVRAQLLLHPGEPWSLARAHETMRNLRGLDFLLPERLVARQVGDSVDVEVVTRDTWTTSPEINLESGGGQRFGSMAFTEKNLLGLGTTLSFSYREDPIGISRSLTLSDGDLFGTHFRGNFSVGTGSGGKTNSTSLVLPFYAEDTPLSYGASWFRGDSRAHLFQRALEQASFDQRTEEFEAFWGRGVRVAGVIQRFMASVYTFDHRLGPSTLEPGAPEEFNGGEENLRIRRVAGEFRRWRPNYVEKHGVEQFDRVEDFDLGSSFACKVGFAPRFLGSTADEGYARFKLETGAETRRFGFGLLRSTVSTRLRSRAVETLGQLQVRWIQQPTPDQTFVVAFYGVAGDNMPRDFQAVIGGLNGLRAYPVHAIAGDQVWRSNFEHRWIAARDCWDLVSIGAATFYDNARAWGRGSAGAGWYHDAGIGLRLSLPHSALNQVARFDVAWPVSPTRDGRREPVFSFGSSQAF